MNNELLTIREKLLDLVCVYEEDYFHAYRKLSNKYNESIARSALEIEKELLKKRQYQQMLTLARQSVVRGEPIDLEELTSSVVCEYTTVTSSLNNRCLDVVEINDFLSLREKQELREKFRIMMNRVHPIVNGEALENKMGLFKEALQAYNDYNLPALRYLVRTTASVLVREEYQGASYDKRKQELNQAIDFYQKRLDNLHSQKPFELASILNDNEKTRQYQQQLQATLTKLQQENTYYEKMLKELVN